jgi:hypothetical protein
MNMHRSVHNYNSIIMAGTRTSSVGRGGDGIGGNVLCTRCISIRARVIGSTEVVGCRLVHFGETKPESNYRVPAFFC